MISDLYDTFIASIVSLKVMQSNIKTIVTRERIDIEKTIERSPNSSEDKIFQSLHNPFFKSPISGEYIFSNLIEMSIEDRKKLLKDNKNRQYQWLLAEGYELYEDFLENLYGEIVNSGYTLKANNSFELSRKLGGRNILNKLRKEFPELERYENINELNIDYKLFIPLIENLRHIIVHEKGKALSQDDFIESVFKKMGFSCKSKEAKAKKAEIVRFFDGSVNISHQIRLLELKDSPQSLLHDDRLGFLFEVLMTHAHIIFEILPNTLKTKSVKHIIT